MFNAEQVAKVREWLAAGAPGLTDEQPEADPRAHWAYQVPQNTHKTIDALHAAHLAAKSLKGGLRRGAFTHQNGGCAHAHRKAQAIAEAVGEEQLGRRETHVVLAQLQKALPIELSRPVGIRVRVNRPLGATCGA